MGNITSSLSRSGTEWLETNYGEEMWALYELGDRHPDSALSGQFEFDERIADVDSVMQSIIDAREEAIIRQQGREAAAQGD